MVSTRVKEKEKKKIKSPMISLSIACILNQDQKVHIYMKRKSAIGTLNSMSCQIVTQRQNTTIKQPTSLSSWPSLKSKTRIDLKLTNIQIS